MPFISPKITLKQEPEKTFLDEMQDLPQALSKMLFHRGIKNRKEAEIFISPDYDMHTFDPALLKDAEKSAQRIWQAILENQKICIYSDYDADGIPGAVILYDFFKKINYQNFFNYIPHRNREGFGLNQNAVKEIFEKGAKLIITIDCGIADVKQVDLANQLKMDVIITDHHEIAGELPKAFAIVNPKQPDCDYPEKMLCGSAVIFKVVQMLLKVGNRVAPKLVKDIPIGWEKWLLDMVAIATISDMIPLIGENRVLAKYGIKVLQKTRRKGLLKLLRKNRIEPKNINEDDIGFIIAPRINAASRMGEPEVAFTLLSTDSDFEADRALKELEKINNERKGTVASIVKEIKTELKKKSLANQNFVLKGNPNWSPSLLGLAANSIMEEMRCPVFLWGRGEGENFKGSCRSGGKELGQINLVEVMKKISPEILPEFGGHEKAGGFVVSERGIFEFENALEKAISKIGNQNSFNDKQEIIVDLKISAKEIEESLLNHINKLSPFGIDNEKPLIWFSDLILERIEKFGANNNHLKIIFKKEANNSYSNSIEAIKFFFTENNLLEDFYKKKQNGEIVTINILGHLEKSYFGYRSQIRIKIIDFW